MARVFYAADYQKKDGSPLRIEFDMTYFLDTSTVKPKIFGFVAGDEMALYRQHGLMPEKTAERSKPGSRARPGAAEGVPQRPHH